MFIYIYHIVMYTIYVFISVCLCAYVNALERECVSVHDPYMRIYK